MIKRIKKLRRHYYVRPHVFLIGMREGLPLCLGVAGYSFLFGLLAQQKSIDFLAFMAMNIFMFTGSLQLLIAQLWSDPVPFFDIILLGLVMNMRHVLMGTALFPFIRHLPRYQVLVSLFFMIDESWGLSIRRWQIYKPDISFMVGVGFVIYLGWNISALLGYLTLDLFMDPAKINIFLENWRFGFVFVIVFTIILTGLYKGKHQILPWITAAIFAVTAEYFLGGKWHIIIGAIMGSLMGLWLEHKKGYLPSQEKQQEKEHSVHQQSSMGSNQKEGRSS